MMDDLEWFDEETTRTLQRVLPRIEAAFKEKTDPAEWEGYKERA